MSRHRVLHLSDTHVSAAGPDEDGVDGLAALGQMLQDVRHLPDLDLVVVSGDIADDGSEQGCLAVRESIGAFADARGIPHVYCTGNHDDRKGFAAALGSGHVGTGGVDIGRRARDVDGALAAVSEASGLRVITLDSLVPGSTHGELDTSQLEWLRSELSEPAPGGSIVILHHPPVSVPPIGYMESVALQRPEELGRVIAQSDVHVVLCGHLHHQLSGSVGGKPVWVTPGVVTRIDLTAPSHAMRGVLGASASVIDVDTDVPPTFRLLHARDRRAGEEVYDFDPVSGAQVLEA